MSLKKCSLNNLILLCVCTVQDLFKFVQGHVSVIFFDPDLKKNISIQQMYNCTVHK